ncbi:MAG TPA: MFS transporter [Actinocatenispora sp.]
MLLVNRDYARLWAGHAISTVGDYIFDTTLVLWVGTVLLHDRSYAPAAVSGLLAAVALATMLVAPVAGVFVDRWDRRRTMLVADLVRAALVVLAYAVVTLAAASAQFFNPARFALIGQVVADPADRSRAAGIGQAAQRLLRRREPARRHPVVRHARHGRGHRRGGRRAARRRDRGETRQLPRLLVRAALAGIAVAGWLASTVLLGFHAAPLGVGFGRIDTIFLGAGLLIVAGGGYAVVALRGTDRAPAVVPEAEPVAG